MKLKKHKNPYMVATTCYQRPNSLLDFYEIRSY